MDELIIVEEYIDIRKRLEELDCSQPKGIAILPENFEHASDRLELHQSTAAITLTKLLRQHGLLVSDLYGAKDPPQFMIERSYSELIPTIFITSALISEHPDAVSMILNSIESFCRTQVTFARKNTHVKFAILKETQRSSSYLKINYEGPESGIKEIAKIVESDGSDE